MDSAQTADEPGGSSHSGPGLSGADLEAVLQALPTGALLVDASGVIVAANDLVERMFAVARCALVGRAVESLIPRQIRGEHAGMRASFMVGERPTRMGHGRELAALRSDGTVFPVEVGISRISALGGPLVLATVHDISARKAREEALRTSEERFLQLVGNIREVFWLVDPAGARLVYLSPVSESLFGRSPEELMASPDGLLDAVHPDDRERVSRCFSADGIEDCEVEYRAVRPDGEVRWVRGHAYPVRDATGRLIRVAGVAEDVTERRQLEARLRQTQKMESVGLLAGGVAHDFNNWLTVIAGNSDALLSELADHDPLRELVHEIRQAGERAATLTRQLLAFSRQQVMEPRVIDLGAVVTDTERMLRRLLGEQVTLVTSVAPSLRCVVADAGLMGQVLLNLSLNARDAMPAGGMLSIDLRDVTLDEEHARVNPSIKPGRFVRITVSDSGVGMSPEVRARLFEPFFTTKGPGKGTGLGLAVVHGIVTQSGGHIDVRSEPDAGATFEVFLPAVDARAPVERVALTPKSLNGHESVLLVEDEDTVRRVAYRALVARGYDVLQASGAEEAMELLEARGGTVDALVTDVVMPRIGGRELAEMVTRRCPSVRVLFTSGYAADAVVRHGVLQAEVAFLQKPYTSQSLVAKVREVLDRDAPLVESDARK